MGLNTPPQLLSSEGWRVRQPVRREARRPKSTAFGTQPQTWSIRQTFKWFHASAIELPVSKSGGGGTGVVWQLPTQPFVGNLLRNPFYAGAYVYGRRPKQTVFVDGRLRKRTCRLRRPQECRVFIRDHHEGYIDWATYEEHQRMIRRNGLRLERDETVAAVRAGEGLLVGLLRCGRCGRKLQVRYRGKHGTAGRYACRGDFDAGGRYCMAFGGRTVDHRFSEQLLEVISPWGLQASLEAIERLGAGEQERRQALARQLQQLEYEAQRAFEQYDETDPRHRLVAAELERRWNAKLQEVEQTRAALAQTEGEVRPIGAAEREAILALGDCFPEVWHSEDCPMETRKKIVRTVVEEVVVNLDEATQRLRFTLHWKGGTHTQFEMDKPRSGAGRKTSMEALEIIQRMAERYGDDQIAAVLNRLGHRTGQDKRWNEHRVATTRRNYAIVGHKRTPEDPEVLSLGQAAKYCGVSQTTIKRLVASGLLHVGQVVPYAPWEIRRPDLDSEPVKSIIERLRRTGKLVLQGGCSGSQSTLFAANTEV